MRVKTIVAVDGDDEAEVARFTLADDGTLTSHYDGSSTRLREQHEELGIVGGPGPRIKLAEGRAFFDALDVHYARSSVLCVVPVDASGAA